MQEMIMSMLALEVREFPLKGVEDFRRRDPR